MNPPRPALSNRGTVSPNPSEKWVIASLQLPQSGFFGSAGSFFMKEPLWPLPETPRKLEKRSIGAVRQRYALAILQAKVYQGGVAPGLSLL
jgi:hypothetical protein